MWAPSWPRLGPMLAPCWPILGPMSGLCWRYPRPSMLKDLQDANFSVPDPQDSRETQSLPLSSNRIDPQVLPICSLQSLLVGILWIHLPMLITLNLQFFSLTSQMLLWAASQNQRLATARRAGCGFEVQRGRATIACDEFGFVDFAVCSVSACKSLTAIAWARHPVCNPSGQISLLQKSWGVKGGP